MFRNGFRKAQDSRLANDDEAVIRIGATTAPIGKSPCSTASSSTGAFSDSEFNGQLDDSSVQSPSKTVPAGLQLNQAEELSNRQCSTSLTSSGAFSDNSLDNHGDTPLEPVPLTWAAANITDLSAFILTQPVPAVSAIASTRPVVAAGHAANSLSSSLPQPPQESIVASR